MGGEGDSRWSKPPVRQNHNISVALEPHRVPGLQRRDRAQVARGLRASIGVNFDPSHFFWQGVDVPTAIRALGPAIFHVHAKDSAIDEYNVRMNGVIDAKSYRRMPDRSWLFRTVGWGHDELEWKKIVSALRLIGYDYVMSIEHEDALASVEEGLHQAVNFLSRLVLTQPPAEPWWT
jgi:sugar phosphate isomerase/epimerase